MNFHTNTIRQPAPRWKHRVFSAPRRPYMPPTQSVSPHAPPRQSNHYSGFYHHEIALLVVEFQIITLQFGYLVLGFFGSASSLWDSSGLLCLLVLFFLVIAEWFFQSCECTTICHAFCCWWTFDFIPAWRNSCKSCCEHRFPKSLVAHANSVTFVEWNCWATGQGRLY